MTGVEGKSPFSSLRARWSETWTILQTPSIERDLMIVQGTSSVTAGILVTSLPLLLISRGLSLISVAGVFTIIALTSLAVQLAAPRATWLLSNRSVVLGLLLVSPIMLPFYLFVETAPQFLLVAAISSLASAAAGPALQTMMVDAVPPPERARAFARLQGVSGILYACGIIAAGFLMSFGFAPAFYVGSLLSLGGLLLTLRVAGNARGQRSRRLPAAAHGMRDWALDLKRARLALMGRVPIPLQVSANTRALTLRALLFTLGVSIYPVLFPLHLRSLGLPLHSIGLVIAASWFAFALAAPFGAAFVDRTGKYRTLIVATLIAAALLNLVMAQVSLVGVIVAWTLLGLADGIGRPVIDALTAASTKAAWRGEAFSMTAAATTAGRLAGPLSMAFFISWTSFSAGLMVVAALTALSSIPVLFVRSYGESSRPAPPDGVPT